MYVCIYIVYTRYAHIWLFFVQRKVDPLKNLALGKHTEQSTTSGHRAYSSRAVDGNINSIFDDKSCTHTKTTKGNWWQVDLVDVYEIRDVVITNRGDCCGKFNLNLIWASQRNAVSKQ